MAETREVMIKRMRMRSMRRGIKEMDLILSGFSDRHLDGFDDTQLANYDALLAEYDHDIYSWITGHGTAPGRYADVIAKIKSEAKGIVKP